MDSVLPLALHVTVTGRYSPLSAVVPQDGTRGFASAGWIAANRALYIPVSLAARFTVARFMTANGAVVAGNFDAGLYDANGNRLISTGTTAQAGVSVVQYVDVTNQSFPAGLYYLAMVGSSTSGRYMRTLPATLQRAQLAGVLKEDLGSTVLPATMTPAALTTNDLYNWGFTQSDTL